MAVGWRKQYEAIIAAIYQPLAGQDFGGCLSRGAWRFFG
jgi:hypothetical protein